MNILWDFSFVNNGGGLSSFEEFNKYIINKKKGENNHIVINPFKEEVKENVKFIKMNNISRLKKVFFSIFILKRIIIQENIDVIVYAGGIPNPFIRRIPCVLFIRQALYFEKMAREKISLKSRMIVFIKKFLLKITAKKAKIIFVQTNWMKDKVKKSFKPKGLIVKLVWNTFNNISERNKRKFSDHMENENINLLYVSLPRPYKNHIYLLRGFKIAIDRGFKGKLILTCPRKEEAKSKTEINIINEINKLNIENNIELTGIISREKTLRLYEKSDIFIFPSLCESFGVPLLEALNYCMPIIGSNIEVVKEVTYNKFIYFDPNNPKEIADKIIEAQKNIDNLSKVSKKIFDTKYKNKCLWNEVIENVGSCFEKEN